MPKTKTSHLLQHHTIAYITFTFTVEYSKVTISSLGEESTMFDQWCTLIRIVCLAKQNTCTLSL